MDSVIALLTGLIGLAIVVFYIAAGWKIFTKARQPGWAILIPIYNAIVILKMIGRPLWWLVLFFIPIVNFVIAIIVAIDLARVFGKGAGFGLGLVFLGFIFYPILGIRIGPVHATTRARLAHRDSWGLMRAFGPGRSLPEPAASTASRR